MIEPVKSQSDWAVKVYNVWYALSIKLNKKSLLFHCYSTEISNFWYQNCHFQLFFVYKWQENRKNTQILLVLKVDSRFSKESSRYLIRAIPLFLTLHFFIKIWMNCITSHLTHKIIDHSDGEKTYYRLVNLFKILKKKVKYSYK